MAKMKVDPAALQQFLDAGHTQADAAKHFGVSEAAISQRVTQARIATSKVVALERVADVVDQKLDATERLQRVQRVIDEELSWAVARVKEPGVDRAALQEIILKLAGEVRQQLALQLSITRTLVDRSSSRPGVPAERPPNHRGRITGCCTAYRGPAEGATGPSTERRPPDPRPFRKLRCGMTRWTN